MSNQSPLHAELNTIISLITVCRDSIRVANVLELWAVEDVLKITLDRLFDLQEQQLEQPRTEENSHG